MSWSSAFDDPIPLPRGRRLVTLEDAGNYVTKLPKAVHEAAEWQAAMEALILASDARRRSWPTPGRARVVSVQSRQREPSFYHGRRPGKGERCDSHAGRNEEFREVSFCRRRRRAAGVAPARVSWLISLEARGTSHLNCDGESERTQGRPKRFRTSERPRNSRERNWSTREMSPRGRSILICRKGRSPQRRCLNGSKRRMKSIWLEPAYHRRIIRRMLDVGLS